MSRTFYDQLAPFYHLIFPDWDASIQRQAKALDRLIRREWGSQAESILDVSCGIGTQAIGLAALGYTVTASDLAPEAVRRAQREAEARDLDIAFSVADMREVHAHHERSVDVLISCDNSVPHLLSDAAISKAFASFYRCIRPGGGCLISVRDYSRDKRSGIRVIPHGVRHTHDRRYVLFQVWEFDGPCYDLSMYVIEDAGGATGTTRIFRTRYYAVLPERLEELLKQAGFRSVHWAESEYYQPVLAGSK